MLDMKIPTDKKASGTVLQEDVRDKRSKEELMDFVKDPSDVGFFYKVIQNNAILKFPIYLNSKFNLDQDEVKFAFNIILTQKRSGQVIEMKIPIQVNAGKLKVNQQQHISSSQSTASL
jgi:CRISPR/Cas system endoribonuclease Cas6 (RAMP superfamily)